MTDQLLATMDAMEMVIVTSDYWGAVHGADPGEALRDTEGIEVLAKLARNIAWAVKVIDAAKGKIDPPKTQTRTFTNFIRQDAPCGYIHCPILPLEKARKRTASFSGCPFSCLL